MVEKAGDRFGKYTLLDKLGEGGMATVWRAVAVDPDKGMPPRLVAVKIFHPSISPRDIEREVENTVRLQGEGVVRLRDHGKGPEGQRYIVQDLYRGDLEGARPQDLNCILKKVYIILDALEKVHSRGMIHRDLKPENILLDHHDLVIADVGIARLKGKGPTIKGMVEGTPLYMSPEQACGESTDERSDLWSIGVMLYEFLSGGPMPFWGKNLLVITYKIIQEDPPPLPEEVPAVLRQVVQKALEKNPDDRFQSAKEMRQALGKIVGMGRTREMDEWGSSPPPQCIVPASSEDSSPCDDISFCREMDVWEEVQARNWKMYTYTLGFLAAVVIAGGIVLAWIS